ncbi:hypothetical protein HpMS14_13530 [Helicobacter pylori]
MLYPFLKIPLHYSASDRARKVRNKNLKIKKRFEESIKSAKRKRSIPPQKKEFKKRGFKKRKL